MSVESDTAGAHAAAAAAEPAAPAANPIPLALITVLPGAITLGLWFVGYLDTTALPGGMIPILMFSAGMGLIISTIWAARERANAVAGVLGLFAAFWFSFGFLVLALNNGWIINAGTGEAITADQVANIQATYLLSFTIVFILMTLATLRLPLAFTTAFVFVDITFVLAFIGVSAGAAGLFPIAGITTFIFSAVFAYIAYANFAQDLGGKEMAMGNPIQK
ncbi:MAG: GPR1/FUN34/YaaH family transporter [Pseudonocardia sediminis]